MPCPFLRTLESVFEERGQRVFVISIHPVELSCVKRKKTPTGSVTDHYLIQLKTETKEEQKDNSIMLCWQGGVSNSLLLTGFAQNIEILFQGLSKDFSRTSYIFQGLHWATILH